MSQEKFIYLYSKLILLFLFRRRASSIKLLGHAREANHMVKTRTTIGSKVPHAQLLLFPPHSRFLIHLRSGLRQQSVDSRASFGIVLQACSAAILFLLFQRACNREDHRRVQSESPGVGTSLFITIRFLNFVYLTVRFTRDLHFYPVRCGWC